MAAHDNHHHHHHHRSTSSASHGASMAAAAAAAGTGSGRHSYFEQQRGELLKDIALIPATTNLRYIKLCITALTNDAQSLDQVLQNLNRLNRNLESIITVGNEFSSVEALWSQFESVMGQQKEDAGADDDGEEDEQRETQAEQSGGESGDEHGGDSEERERGRGRSTRAEEKGSSGGRFDDGRGRSG